MLSNLANQKCNMLTVEFGLLCMHPGTAQVYNFALERSYIIIRWLAHAGRHIYHPHIKYSGCLQLMCFCMPRETSPLLQASKKKAVNSKSGIACVSSAIVSGQSNAAKANVQRHSQRLATKVLIADEEDHLIVDFDSIASGCSIIVLDWQRQAVVC